MKRNFFVAARALLRAVRACALLCLLCGAVSATLVAAAWGRPSSPEAPPPQGEPQGQFPREAQRGDWRNLSPAQREAIRRLSQEEREALVGRPYRRQGAGPLAGTRLSPEERRQLRQQIREEHERRTGRSGLGKRP